MEYKSNISEFQIIYKRNINKILTKYKLSVTKYNQIINQI